jgi:hypothetical protein
MAEPIQTNLPVNQPSVDTNDIDALQKQYIQGNQALQNVLLSQMNQKPDIGQALSEFGAKTATGSFGESAQKFNQNIAQQQQRINEQLPNQIQMRTQLAKNSLDTAKAAGMRQVASTFLQPTETTDEKGNVKKGYAINPESIANIMKFSDDPMGDMGKFADSIPKLRKAGMLGSKDAQGTPFDALSMMITDPLIKAQVNQLANQYKNGLIDDDKANTLAQQILTMTTTHMDRKAQRAVTAMLGMISAGIAQSNLEIKQQAATDKRDSDSKKLTDEQKITYNKIIVPILTQGTKANQALTEMESLRKYVNDMPESVVGNVKAYVPGSPSATALRELVATSKRLIATVPRLPGSASNLDSNNLELGLGKLQDPLLSRKQRLKILESVETSFKNLADDADRYQIYWDSNRKVAPPRNKVIDLNDLPSETGAK